MFSCKNVSNSDSAVEAEGYIIKDTDFVISRTDYINKLEGFWLAQCIANMTGLVTEMDKIGNIGEIKTGEFYMERWMPMTSLHLNRIQSGSKTIMSMNSEDF